MTRPFLRGRCFPVVGSTGGGFSNLRTWKSASARASSLSEESVAILRRRSMFWSPPARIMLFMIRRSTIHVDFPMR